MSLVIVKASAIAIYQNRTTNTDTANGNHPNQNPNILSHFQATTSEFITTVPQAAVGQVPALEYNQAHKANSTVTNHIIRTNIIVGGSRDLEKPQDKMRAKLQQLLQREKDDDEEKRQLQLQDQQQQQQQQQIQAHQLIAQEEQLYQQQQYENHQQQQQQQQQSRHAILAGENAYLLERIDNNEGAGSGGTGGTGGTGAGGRGTHEQPIYGTWNTKARRPQAPAKPTPTTSVATSSSLQTLIGEVDEHVYDNRNQATHHYERLPRRSATMTPVRRELHDQIPRPPRLTSRQPSLAVRRQFTDTSMQNGGSSVRDESQRPKPFHFPFDGPLPEEFKKQQQSERGFEEVHNIQDILQKLHLGGLASTKMPSLVMMPTGLHISGSYKNLKSSGLANFFRGKRHKKQIPLQFQMPMQMFNGYQLPPIMGLMPQAYQPRIAMDHIYPFKPRSPNDINLLAMQQQQQQQQHQQHLLKNANKSKKQKKKQKDKDKKNPLASNNILMQHYPYATAAPELLYPTMYPPLMAINVTQTPSLMAKRVPFKLNLDIFPVLPPSRNMKPMPALAMDEARLVSSMRPPTVLRNPFMEYFSTPVTPTVSSLGFYNSYMPKPYNPMRFPGAVANMAANTNNIQSAYSDQLQKYIQQQQLQQQQQQQQRQQQQQQQQIQSQQQQQQPHIYANLQNGQGHQTPFQPIDCDQTLPSGSGSGSIATSNANTSPIMLHLNVFPKKKTASVSPLSTNPFYNNIPNHTSNNFHRSTIHEEGLGGGGGDTSGPVEPRHQAKSLNDSSLVPIARSDTTNNDQQRDLVDFDHPIVAANDISELPTPAALVGSKPMDSSLAPIPFYDQRANVTTIPLNMSSNNNYNSNTNLEQMVSEAKTASLFRFPVEDLIQFQVHDAM